MLSSGGVESSLALATYNRTWKFTFFEVEDFVRRRLDDLSIIKDIPNWFNMPFISFRWLVRPTHYSFNKLLSCT